MGVHIDGLPSNRERVKTAIKVLTMAEGLGFTTSLVVMSAVFAISQQFDPITHLITWTFGQAYLTPMRTEAQKLAWLAAGLFVRTHPTISFLYLFYLSHYISGRMHYFFYIWTDYFLWRMQKNIDSTKMTFQVFGQNSTSWVETMAANMLHYYNAYMQQENMMSRLAGTVEALKLRPMELTEPVIDYSNKEHHHPAEAKELVEWAKSFQWYLKLAALIFMGLLVHSTGVPYYIIVTLSLYHMFSGKTEVIKRGKKTIPPMDGIYLINNYNLGILWERSIGVCVNGVMHATYHATGDKWLRINGTLHAPTYVDVERDLVSWGGEPQMEVPREGAEVYALVNRLGGQTTYKLNMEVVGRDATWPKVTEPGESGSPIVMKTETGLVLLALAGNYVTDSGKGTEFGVVATTPISKPIDMQTGVVHLISAPPGSGKTFRTIPKICKEFVAERKGVILVSGPTRVVCREIYSALMSQLDHGLVGAKVRGLPENHRARVVIAAHATFAKLIVEDHPLVQRIKGIVVDESHVDDKATELIKAYAQERANAGQMAWFLSATHPGNVSTGSNYTITDYEFRPGELESLVRRLIDEEEKRVLVFVPGIKGRTGTDVLQEKFKKYKPVILNSLTYEREKKRLDDETNKLILSTNIAECGLNAAINAVVDLSENFYYTYNAGSVVGVMDTVSRASQVQRRGRVGRTTTGEYYYVREPVTEFRTDTAERYDAHIMMRNLGWYTGTDLYPTEPGISPRQVAKAFETGLPPRYVALIYNRLGQRRTGEDLNEAVNEWLNGDVNFSGCSRPKCSCAGNYTFWDERVHDKLMELKYGEKPNRKKKFMFF